MDRHVVIQRILDLFENPRYLEIGVDQGHTFHKLQAAEKYAVDVKFAFDVPHAKSSSENVNTYYYEMPSDDFFTLEAGSQKKFDVVFIDGLHTFDQTLRDFFHASYALNEGGVIIIDDVMPSSYAASIPDLDLTRKFWTATANPDGAWMGDVFRLVFFIEDYLTSFSYATVAENHGQTVMWRAPRPAKGTARKVEDISRLQYVDAVMGLQSFNMQPFDNIEAALATWKHTLGDDDRGAPR